MDKDFMSDFVKTFPLDDGGRLRDGMMTKYRYSDFSDEVAHDERLHRGSLMCRFSEHWEHWEISARRLFKGETLEAIIQEMKEYYRVYCDVIFTGFACVMTDEIFEAVTDLQLRVWQRGGLGRAGFRNYYDLAVDGISPEKWDD